MSAEVERLAAACLLPGFDGLAPPDWLRSWLDRGLGGVVLFARNVADRGQVAELTAALRAGRADAVVAIDEEGGDVTRLEHAAGSSYPGAYALGVVDDTELTERVADALGADLRDVGVNLDFAPVADVNANPRNPIIGIRAFGSDPELVARHVVAFVAGLQGAGVAACAKHFPGHGDTDLDTHHDLPTMTGDLEAALVPFRAAIAAGVRSIMTCHICVPALDGEPATLSRPILTGLLRHDLGFEGAILTDALDMKAISKLVGMDEAAVQSLAAGADGLLLGAGLDERPVATVHKAIVEAVRTGRLGEGRLREAAARVSAIGAVDAAPGAADRGAAAVAAGRAITVEGGVRLARAPLVIELVPEPSVAAGPQAHGLGDVMAAETVRIPEAAVDGLPAVPADRQLVLVLRDAHRHGWQQRAAAALVERAPDAVVVETGLPFWRPRGGAGYVATHGSGRVNLAAAAHVLS